MDKVIYFGNPLKSLTGLKLLRLVHFLLIILFTKISFSFSAIAELVPNGPTILYESDHVIAMGTVSYEATHIFERDQLVFEFRKYPSAYWIHPDRLWFKGSEDQDLKAQNLSFAVETYYYGSDALGRDLCTELSDRNLRKMVDSCSNRTVIRELTKTERMQLQALKKEYQGNYR